MNLWIWIFTHVSFRLIYLSQLEQLFGEMKAGQSDDNDFARQITWPFLNNAPKVFDNLAAISCF